MFCSTCGAKVGDSKFCSNCGNQVEKATTRTASSSTSRARDASGASTGADKAAIKAASTISAKPTSVVPQRVGKTFDRGGATANENESNHSSSALIWSILGLLIFSPLGIVGLVLSQKARAAGGKYKAAMVVGIITCVQTGIAAIALISALIR